MSTEYTNCERPMFHHIERITFLYVGMLLAFGCGRGSVSESKATRAAKEDIQTVRLHFEGFTKSESGAT